jgi:hypothetical protein
MHGQEQGWAEWLAISERASQIRQDPAQVVTARRFGELGPQEAYQLLPAVGLLGLFSQKGQQSPFLV